MRMRKKKNGDIRLQSCGSLWVQNPADLKGKWQSVFEKTAPLHIEIGCGKGGFIMQLAAQNPDINYVAIEKSIDVLVLAVEKAKNSDIKNVKYILGDAFFLLDVFEKSECERIYLNFSDPWPKNRQSKRRLTYHTFLEIYRAILSKNGHIYFKTDNKNLFEFSLNSFCENNYSLRNITLDLHNSSYEGNIMTEYEKLFSEQGMPIYRLEARPMANA